MAHSVDSRPRDGDATERGMPRRAIGGGARHLCRGLRGRTFGELGLLADLSRGVVRLPDVVATGVLALVACVPSDRSAAAAGFWSPVTFAAPTAHASHATGRPACLRQSAVSSSPVSSYRGRGWELRGPRRSPGESTSLHQRIGRRRHVLDAAPPARLAGAPG